ncbi:hypothetical protein L3Q65_00735 (plasmid) [Amycolatopsis sp. FU40]|uniref:hypothetical protein n=1 Tax=Amycolatopsis sp. FU40 TaxID=2914159 RepID=UPI001F22CD3A|nr:hypothetical protein [Amycolatopsis sp. FU40]UKD50853.1 hypothetical protein L3Q65_00735 [Amycolatopsis sp. FU40]
MSTAKQRRAARVQKWMDRYWTRVRRAEQAGDPRAKFDAAVDLLRTALNHTDPARRARTLTQLTVAIASEAEAINQRYIAEGRTE